MVLLLLVNVVLHPWEQLHSKAHHAKAALPFQSFHSLQLVDFMRAGTFEVTDQIADGNMWRT